MTQIQADRSKPRNRGFFHFRQGALTLALLVFGSSAALGQGTVDAAIAEPYNAGLNAANQADFKTAAEKFEATISVAPDFVDAYYNLGLVYQNLNEHEKAEANFRKTLELDPANQTAPRLLADSLYRQAKYADSVSAFENAIAIDSTRVQLFYTLADATSKGFPKDTAKIVGAYNRALDRGPKEPGAYNAAVAIGSACNKAKDYKGALAGYKRAATMKPKSPTPLYNCAIILKKMKRYNEAVQALEKAIPMKTPYGKAEFVLAGIYYNNLKNDVKALEHYEKAAADESFNKRKKAEEYATSIRDYMEKKELHEKEMEAYNGGGND